jgi:hypothetical protein
MRLRIPALLLAAGLLPPATARADACKLVDAQIATSFYMAGCQSVYGLCTSGTVDSGPLKGTTNFEVLTIGPGPTPTSMAYTGVLTITTHSGVLYIHDRGVVDEATGRYFEIDEIVGGTGKFTNATGLLTSQGLALTTGFSGNLGGVVCKGRHDAG